MDLAYGFSSWAACLDPCGHGATLRPARFRLGSPKPDNPLTNSWNPLGSILHSTLDDPTQTIAVKINAVLALRVTLRS